MSTNETESKTVETNAVVVSYGTKIQIHSKTVEALTKLLLEQEKIDKKWLKVADPDRKSTRLNSSH